MPIHPRMLVTQYSKFGFSRPSVFLDTESVLRMHSSSLDLTCAKHFGGSDPIYQVCAQLAQLFLICSMEVMLVKVPLPPPRPTMVGPPKWDIVHIHLVPATQPPNFSPIATIGKKLIF